MHKGSLRYHAWQGNIVNAPLNVMSSVFTDVLELTQSEMYSPLVYNMSVLGSLLVEAFSCMNVYDVYCIIFFENWLYVPL